MGKVFATVTLMATVVAAAACTVHQADVPPISGPSEFALSLRLTATPDTLSMNGSTATVAVKAFDDRGNPKSGLSLRLDIIVGSAIADCGQLTQRTLTTVNGEASTVFTAPTLPLPMPECKNLALDGTGAVTVLATTIGDNASTSTSTLATIRLVQPTVIQAPGGPTANFTITPNPALKAPDFVTFNASGSKAAPGRTLVEYSWNFGDGSTKTGPVVTHDFNPGTYTVVLTVTDDIGQQAFKGGVLTVLP
jgi:PKD domain